MKRLLLNSAICLALPLLAGCGFHLRGSVELPPEWRTLHLGGANPNGELTSALRAGFESNGVALTGPGAANYRLELGEERFERRNLTIGGNARAAEFELVMTTSLRVSDSAGRELLPRTELSTRKVMTHDPENVAGKAEESRLLRREMREELILQLLRLVRFLAGAPGGARES